MSTLVDTLIELCRDACNLRDEDGTHPCCRAFYHHNFEPSELVFEAIMELKVDLSRDPLLFNALESELDYSTIEFLLEIFPDAAKIARNGRLPLSFAYIHFSTIELVMEAYPKALKIEDNDAREIIHLMPRKQK